METLHIIWHLDSPAGWSRGRSWSFENCACLIIWNISAAVSVSFCFELNFHRVCRCSHTLIHARLRRNRLHQCMWTTQSCQSGVQQTRVHKYKCAHTVTTPSCGSELIITAVLPSTLPHTPPPLSVCSTLSASCYSALMDQQKVAVCKLAQKWQINTRPTDSNRSSWPFIFYTAHSNCLQMPSISLPTHNHKHAPPFGIPFPPLVSQVIRIRVHAYVFVCCRRLPYFLGLFLISPRAFKIWPGQMGKGVWPTLMDSRPIKRMSMLSKARGPCIPGCVLVCAYKRQEKKIVFMCQYANKHSSSTLLLTV